jgi:uncharacterized protein YjbI with pentapeptide repeats
MKVNICPPFLHGTKVTSRLPGQLEMTVVVRGVFRLAPNEPVVPIADLPQKLLSGDVFRDGDDDRTGALVYASDFGDFKLKTDLLLRGTCHPGAGRSAQVSTVRFAVGTWSKSLRVFGRRVWTDRLGDPISEPAPFESMPLTYENAFGGPEFARNPVGKGYRTPELPSIEDPRAQLRSRRDTPEPASFGPISPSWPQRSGKLGTDYGKTWKKTRAPFYAADFDWSHFNAAPLDQQLDGYLRGDEPLVFEYLHPRAIRFTASLPGIRPRVVCRRTDGVTTDVPMNLDTLLADVDGERLVLLWRGHAKVTDDQLDDVRTLFLGCEPLGAPKPAEHYLAEVDAFEKNPVQYLADQLFPASAKEQLEKGKDMAAKLTAEAEARAKQPPPAKDPAAVLESMLASQNDVSPEQAAQKQVLLDKVRSFLQENLGKQADLAAKSTVPPTQDGAERLMADGLAKVRALAASKGMPTDRLDAAEKALAGAEAKPGAGGKLLAGGAPGPGVNLMGRDLSGWDLRGADLHGALLRKAKLVGTKLAGANLAGADLGAADLEGADLTGADLTQTNLTEAHAPSAVFDEATLARTIFVKTDLEGASFARAKGTMTIFQEARMGSAKLTGARFEKGLFSKAILEGADFTGVDFVGGAFVEVSAIGARFDRARLDRTCFLRSILTRAVFYGATGAGGSWHGSTLDEADFRFAKLRRSQFNRASLDRAQLYASDFRGSRFDRASLAGTGFGKADLMSVSFNKAKLDATDFSGASLYDAKFLGAVASTKCNFDGANLKRAIWEQP